MVVDTLGLLLTVVVHSAAIQDPRGAETVFERLNQFVWPRLQKIWADGIYTQALLKWVKDCFGWTLEIVERDPQVTGFQVQPKRWVIERTFAWLGRHRRLSKDYEFLPQTSECWIYIAMTGLMTRRLAINP